MIRPILFGGHLAGATFARCAAIPHRGAGLSSQETALRQKYPDGLIC